MIDGQYLLSDEQMRDYITRGYLVLRTSLPASFHEQIYRRTAEVVEKESNPGNNILPRVPQLRRVFEDPVLTGALTSVLGPDYLMHSHRHCHVNPGGSPGGGAHKDSYWGYHKVRCHRTRWAMLFYYPQDVTLANGPTAVVPGTQTYEARASWEPHVEPSACVGEAGTAVLVHFDLWHRACPNSTQRTRFMMKFQFTRMAEPRKPTWRAGSSAWPGGNGEGERHRAMWTNLWNWHRGKPFAAPRRSRGAGKDAVAALRSGPLDERLEAANRLAAPGAAEGALDALLSALRDEAEPLRLNAAYALGAIGAPAVDGLVAGLDDPLEPARLGAAYGLAAAGPPAVPALILACGADGEPARGYAAFALGEIGNDAGPDGAAAVAGLARDGAPWVRRHAAEAMGLMTRQAERTLPALVTLMADADDQTRFNAAYSLARLGREAAPATDALVAALEDGNRYVRNHSAEALQRIGTPSALAALNEFLTVSRWCPITSKESTY